MGRRNKELGVFHKSFIGKNISFTEEYPSTWTLIDKLGDKYCRYDEFEYHEDDEPPSTESGFLDRAPKTGWMMQSLRSIKFIWPTKYSFSYSKLLQLKIITISSCT